MNNNYKEVDKWEVEFNRGFADARDKSINMKLRKGLRVEDIKSFIRTVLHSALKSQAEVKVGGKTYKATITA